MSQQPRENCVDYVEFPAIDIDKTKEFYKQVFGWTFEDYGPDYTSFADGRLNGGFTKDLPAPAAGLLVVIFASDLAGTLAKVQSAGGTIVKDIFTFPGGKRFHFTDPNQNVLAVWSDLD